MKKRSNLPEPPRPAPAEVQPQPRPTTFARVRLIIAAVLLAGWLGWLAFLAATVTHPIVLSRAQFLVSTLDVIADVQEVDGHASPDVVVKEVHWPTSGAEAVVGKTISVTNLSQRLGDKVSWSFPQGWRGPGEYILPLVADGDHYRVALIPPSPGYDAGVEIFSPPHIYPVTPETRHQLDTMPKPEPSSQP
ncbi:MAG TPA: hypothetical protein VFA18_24930 [Gemmataceae bacterium]|nr:hypothetical protein [Gemmataceae bacterium]